MAVILLYSTLPDSNSDYITFNYYNFVQALEAVFEDSPLQLANTKFVLKVICSSIKNQVSSLYYTPFNCYCHVAIFNETRFPFHFPSSYRDSAPVQSHGKSDLTSEDCER